MENYLLLAGGFVLLIVGGELLVRGAARTATLLGMSPLLIGLTLVASGRRRLELVTSVEASLRGSPGIAIGNIVGSNIANILLILGVAALLHSHCCQSPRLSSPRSGNRSRLRPSCSLG